MIAGNITNLKTRSIIPVDQNALVYWRAKKRFLLRYECARQGSKILNHCKPMDRSGNGSGTRRWDLGWFMI